MREISSKRVMIAAPGSRSGKTTITCALLQALKDRGIDLVSFKCGPDYIDPMFHKKVLGIDGRNLDTFFSGTEGIRSLVADCGERYAVIEGVMGLYDGITPDSVEGSCYDVAEIVKAPIILVVDASGVGRTIISMIKGILLDDRSSLIKGIILNRMTENFYQKLKPVLEKELLELRKDVKLLGFFPKKSDISIDSRHLGLQLPGEISDIKKKISEAALILEKSVDVNEIISIMECAERIEFLEKYKGEQICAAAPLTSNTDNSNYDDLKLAVAMDEAFCFYYRENFELFEKLGVSLQFFSPLHDEKLPDDCHGILLGGGYPENYLDGLSNNKTMLYSIKSALERGVPSLAECGGFMYLHRSVTGADGRNYELIGAIDGECHFAGHLVRFGYMEIDEAKNAMTTDPLAKSLKGMKGHEFHYYESSFPGDACVARKPNGDVKWKCMVASKNGFWGFPHFYYNSNPKFISEFVSRMKEPDGLS